MLPGVSEKEAAEQMRQKPTNVPRALARFAQRAKLLSERAQAVNVRRAQNQTAYGKQIVRRARLFTPADAADPGKEWLERFMTVKRCKVLDASISNLPELLLPEDKDDVRISKLREADSSEQLLDFARRCRVVVVVVDSRQDMFLAAPKVSKKFGSSLSKMLFLFE